MTDTETVITPLSIEVTQTGAFGLPLTKLHAAVAAGQFAMVKSAEWVSPADWNEVRDVVAQASKIVYEHNGRRRDSLLIESPQAMAALTREYGDEWTLTVAVPQTKVADRWTAALDSLLFPYPPPPPPTPRPDNVVPVAFWMRNPMTGGAHARWRDITVQKWSDVSGNYPGKTRTEVESLMGLEEPGGGGKLMLFHGPPGTGKTRAILTLISEWRHWCTASVVTDSDRFFGDPTYLNDLLFDSVGRRDWMLLIIEDGDEYMNVSGRESKGQDIARLLNVADGIIGQGLNLLTLITTNVPMAELNPAVVRAGRCMANVQFPAFGPDEANAWLAERGSGRTVEDESTLAQMYHVLRTEQRRDELLERFTD